MAADLQLFYRYGVRKTLHKLTVAVASALRAPMLACERWTGRALLPKAVRTAYGVTMRARWNDRTFRYCYHGTYGTALSDFIASIPEDFVFLDIGANQGLYTLLAARNPRCLGAIAFEPVPSTFGVLEENVALNDLSARVTCIRAAVSDTAGETQVAINAAHSGAASMACKSNFDSRNTETIRLITIHDIDRLIPPAGDIVIKIDVEGHEDVVVRELTKSAHASRMRAIFYEIDEKWNDAADIRSVLEGLGFSQFTKLGVRHHYDVLAQREVVPSID